MPTNKLELIKVWVSGDDLVMKSNVIETLVKMGYTTWEDEKYASKNITSFYTNKKGRINSTSELWHSFLASDKKEIGAKSLLNPSIIADWVIGTASASTGWPHATNGIDTAIPQTTTTMTSNTTQDVGAIDHPAKQIYPTYAEVAENAPEWWGDKDPSKDRDIEEVNRQPIDPRDAEIKHLGERVTKMITDELRLLKYVAVAESKCRALQKIIDKYEAQMNPIQTPHRYRLTHVWPLPFSNGS